ncbi:MAG: SIR2 family protein, partial [Fimbriimonadaceae bacterium]
MNRMTIKEAVGDIALRLSEAKVHGRLGCALIGAGVSKTGGVPLAADLLEDMLGRYSQHCKDIDPKAPNAYGIAMSKLTIYEQKDLIVDYIKNSKINWGSIALAQLLDDGLVQRVLTVNFDPLLSRACALIGLQPAVYDFAAAPSAEVERLASPAIVHLHGQSYGFVLLNDNEQTTKHGESIAPIIQNSVDNGPLIVLGYSGGADGVFDTLRNEYKSKHRLYWLGYEENPSGKLAEFLNVKHVTYVGNVDADSFLIELARALEAWPPKILNDPLGHLMDMMDGVTASPRFGKDKKESTEDPLEDWKANIRHKKSIDEREEEELREVRRLWWRG